MFDISKCEQNSDKITQFKGECRIFMEDMLHDYSDIIIKDSAIYDEKVSWEYKIHSQIGFLHCEKPVTQKITISFEIVNE